MPRVKLGRDPVKERRDVIRRIIRVGMAKREIRSVEELSHRTSIPQNQLGRRMRGDVSFSEDDLHAIIKVLHLTDDDILGMFGIER